MRYLALDWGTVRVGAAVSDPDGKIAFPLDKFIESKTALDEIKSIIQDLEVEKILVGVPKNMSGEATASTEQALMFIDKLKAVMAAPVEILDERLSSVAAGKALSSIGLSQQQQRGMIDNVAAQLMLQQYLNSKNN